MRLAVLAMLAACTTFDPIERGVCGSDETAHGAVVFPLACGRCRIQLAQHAGQGTQFFE